MSNIFSQSVIPKDKGSLALTIPKSIRNQFKSWRNEGWSQFHPAAVEEIRNTAEILQINMDTLWEVISDGKISENEPHRLHPLVGLVNKGKHDRNEVPEETVEALNALNQSLAKLQDAKIPYSREAKTRSFVPALDSPDFVTNKILPNVRPEASRDLQEANKLGGISSIYHRLSIEKGERHALQKAQAIAQLGADTARISAELRLKQLITLNKGDTKEANKLLLTIRDALYFDSKKTNALSDFINGKLSRFHEIGIKECSRICGGLSNYLWSGSTISEIRGHHSDREIKGLGNTLSAATRFSQLTSLQSSPSHSVSKTVNFHADGFVGSGEEGTFGARKQNLGLAAFTHTEIDLKKTLRRVGRLFGIRSEYPSKQDKVRFQAIAHNDLSIPFTRGFHPHLDQHLGVGAEFDLYKKNNSYATGTLSLPESFIRVGNSFLSAEFALFLPNQPGLFLNINLRNNYGKDLKHFFISSGLTTLVEQIQQTIKQAVNTSEQEKDWKIINANYQERLYQLFFNEKGIQESVVEHTKAVASQFNIPLNDRQGMNNLFLDVLCGITQQSILTIQSAHKKRPGTIDGISISASFHGGSIPLIQPLFRMKDKIKEVISSYQINTVGERGKLRETTIQYDEGGQPILILDQASNTKYYIRTTGGILLRPSNNNITIQSGRPKLFFSEIVREYPNTDKIVEITVHAGDPNEDILQEYVSERNKHIGRVGFYSLNTPGLGADHTISSTTNPIITLASELQYVEPCVAETYRETSSDTALNRFVFKPFFKLLRLPFHNHTPSETRSGHRH